MFNAASVPSSSFSSSSSLPGTPGSPLAAYGWTDELAEQFAPLAGAGLTPARIVRVDRGQCDAVLVDPETGELCTVRADTRPVGDADMINCACTGDWAGVDLAARPMTAVAALLPRSTAIIRKVAGKRSDGQVLAANVDTVLIAASLAAEPDLGRIERFLALAWESGAEPVVVLTKADLVHDAEFIRADVEAAAPGVTVLVVSAETGEGVDVLRACIPGTTAFIGQSGVGKSTLTNVLAGADVMAVQQARAVDQKGRHTTTTRELIALPGGGVLIDTPGLREVGLYGGEGVALAFADIAELAESCRFHDCGHESEPGCAVREALADGTLPERRWESYRKLQRENDWIASRSDARLATARVKKWKAITKSMRAAGGTVKW
ncbi:ribosome small subunit-dependent GTPase A [Kitasatospora sp. CM 4170]|uniref:Small ribosomal subunit biogenesis GTPase RsgA n=1 Tax=Kitasatospora aburaviensis TaxID=67265 RepID=A0ABW1EPC3_9ACTN|nr:ribosome small subunit-dependent GTPase A [Kitasatospora sp. CM 4170]WNM45207.1 ribosome small subunit-dependent GTPase A [Kitasatospora sp. CM 4170]